MEPISIDGLIPHQGRMQLIDTLVAFDRQQKTGDVLVTLKAEAPYFIESVFQGPWLIEIMAQAGAVLSHLLYSKGENNQPTPGFLVSIRQFSRIDRRPLHPGQVLRARALFDVDMETVAQCLGSVFLEDGTLIAESEMTFLSSAAGDFG